jgi:geranylgeranyl reductase family protein
MTKHKIIILGAGPAGATASLFLSKAGLHHTVIDKAIFPRDKICGDALSGKVLPVLKKLHPDLINQLLVDNEHCLGSNGILFAAPNGKSLEVPFKTVTSTLAHPPGFVSKRMDFDFSLVKLFDQTYCTFIQDTEVKNVERTTFGIKLTGKDTAARATSFETQLLLACDGAHSVANKLFGDEHKMQPEHYCGGIRAYYKNVSGMHDQNFIELHFLKELLPGYFWIFPLPNGMVNVGAGMLTKSISKKKVNLKQAMLKAIAENTTINKRFQHAEIIGKIEGWGLPLGSKKRKLSAERILLCGDAASMIDPFSGEGISNAMYCGMRAAEKAVDAVQQNNFSAETLKSYDEVVHNRLWTEMRLSHTLQKLCNYPSLFNFVVNKANKNETFRETISCMFDDIDLRAKFKQPSFYFKMLFGG